MEKFKWEALDLAKKSILEEFWKADLTWYSPKNNQLKEDWACFVTLKTLKNKLKWCIWSIIPHRSLYKDIIENAKLRAFKDPRFNPLSEDEFDNLKMDISILSPLKDISFENIPSLLKYLKKNKPGLVIKLWYKQATFLPSVWEELRNENDFLTHLIYKAGIFMDEFIANFNDVKFAEYYTDEFWSEFSKI